VPSDGRVAQIQLHGRVEQDRRVERPPRGETHAPDSATTPAGSRACLRTSHRSGTGHERIIATWSAYTLTNRAAEESSARRQGTAHALRGSRRREVGSDSGGKVEFRVRGNGRIVGTGRDHREQPAARRARAHRPPMRVLRKRDHSRTWRPPLDSGRMARQERSPRGCPPSIPRSRGRVHGLVA